MPVPCAFCASLSDGPLVGDTEGFGGIGAGLVGVGTFVVPGMLPVDEAGGVGLIGSVFPVGVFGFDEHDSEPPFALSSK